MYRQVAAALATGNQVLIDASCGLQGAFSDLPDTVAARIALTSDWVGDGPFAGALVEGGGERVRAMNRAIGKLAGPLVLVQSATTEELLNDPEAYCLNWLIAEVSTSINTTAAGGNASLMTIGV
jgi:RHH-type proline utilization regulon transcriptional repressor/proline dehydrogenase/delta 1-pyrroline-5-carboxylate dehydrogenase